MGKKMAGTNEFAFFAVEGYVPGGVQNQAEKNSKKCLQAGTGTKIYFSKPNDCSCDDVVHSIAEYFVGPF